MCAQYRSMCVHVCGWMHVCHTVMVLLLSGIDIYGLRIKHVTPPPTTSVTQTQTHTHRFHITVYSYSKTFRANYCTEETKFVIHIF